MTTAQIKFVRGLLAKKGMTDSKEEIVMQYTNGRTTHLTEMNHAETNALINALNGKSAKDDMVGKILSMAHEMGWELANGKVDIKRINAWCEKYTKQKRPLDKIPYEDLPAVVTTFEKVYLSFLKGI